MMIPRIGFGYDIHRTAPGEGIRLGAVHVPAPFSLEAHSDGDVLIHALVDALLGAMGKGDIGTHFPDDDPAFKDAPGSDLLARTVQWVREEGYELGNLDASIIAERPKLGPHIPSMREALAAILNCSSERVSVKATTHEKLGPLGNAEGIAAQAVVLLYSDE